MNVENRHPEAAAFPMIVVFPWEGMYVIRGIRLFQAHEEIHDIHLQRFKVAVFHAFLLEIIIEPLGFSSSAFTMRRLFSKVLIAVLIFGRAHCFDVESNVLAVFTVAVFDQDFDLIERLTEIFRRRRFCPDQI